MQTTCTERVSLNISNTFKQIKSQLYIGMETVPDSQD